MAAMKSALIVLMCLVSGVVLGDAPAPAPSLPEKAELLATNTVVAKYLDTVEHPCRFMTALCPDRCDHATRLARFEVLRSEHYAHPGQYGDEQMKPGSIALVDVKKPVLGQSPDVATTIASLKPGDEVRMTITHYYVQQGQGQFPVRPVVKFELLGADSAPQK